MTMTAKENGKRIEIYENGYFFRKNHYFTSKQVTSP